MAAADVLECCCNVLMVSKGAKINFEHPAANALANEFFTPLTQAASTRLFGEVVSLTFLCRRLNSVLERSCACCTCAPPPAAAATNRRRFVGSKGLLLAKEIVVVDSMLNNRNRNSTILGEVVSVDRCTVIVLNGKGSLLIVRRPTQTIHYCCGLMMK